MENQIKYKAREGYQEANAKYLGLKDEPISGVSDKGAYRKAKLRFHIEGKEKENLFTIWTPLTAPNTKYKSDEELKQFQVYYIGWYEEDIKYNNNEWVDKKIVILSDRSDKLDSKQQVRGQETQKGTSIQSTTYTPLSSEGLPPSDKPVLAEIPITNFDLHRIGAGESCTLGKPGVPLAVRFVLANSFKSDKSDRVVRQYAMQIVAVGLDNVLRKEKIATDIRIVKSDKQKEDVPEPVFDTIEGYSEIF